MAQLPQFLNWLINQPTVIDISMLTGTGNFTATGNFMFNPTTSSFNVDTYGNGSVIGVTGFEIISSDSSSLTGHERYTAWISNTSAGTGDGSVAGSTYSLGISSIKDNWTATTTAGQIGGINIVVRGGDNNVIASGDASTITANCGVSFTNNFSTLFEGTSGYFPAGSTTGSIYIRCTIAPIRSSGLGDL